MTQLKSDVSPRWSMTSAAWSALLAEIDRAGADVRVDRTAESEREDDNLIRLPSVDAIQRQRSLLAIRDAAAVDDMPGVAVIGRRVTVQEDDGRTEAYALVLPGDGDPGRGWISADSPLGTAVLGRRAGDVATVIAPAGVRDVRVVAVE